MICFYRRFVRRMVCVILVQRSGFRRIVAPLFCVWVIRTVKQIQSGKDIKSNHGRQYVIELELYTLIIIELSNI